MEDQWFLATLGSGASDLPRLAVAELRSLGALDVERSGQARFFFRLPPGTGAEALSGLAAPEKIYALVVRVRAAALELPENGPEAEDVLAAMVSASDGWDAALATWRQLVQPEDGAPRSFRVTGNRSGGLAARLSSNGISEAIGEALTSAKGWEVKLRGFDLEVLVHLNDDSLIVYLPLLARASARQHNFACPGLSQPVAWAMARSLNVEPGETVLDPMCGAGIVLLEAVQCWRGALYLGFDSDAAQVQRFAANIDLLSNHLGRNISSSIGNATRLPLATASVDAIVCDLPFGKIYGSEAENEALYPAAVAEFRRVLRPQSGRVVLLTSQANAERLSRALASPAWSVSCQRKLKLGLMDAVLFTATPAESLASAPTSAPGQSMRLPWESAKGRGKWGSMKALAREPLQPVGRRAAP